jgi:hypothetical protein
MRFRQAVELKKNETRWIGRIWSILGWFGFKIGLQPRFD